MVGRSVYHLITHSTPLTSFRTPNAASEMTPIPDMPNKLRALAEDEELYVIMVSIWCDDVSGNQSKQYNKHINIYMANSNIPRRLLQQEYFVRFVSTSPHATSPEQFSVVMDQIKYDSFVYLGPV